MRRAVLPLVLALVTVPAAAAQAAPVPAGAKWTEATITEPDGTQLHADILRPADLPDTAKTPVILSIGPYFNHSGQLGALGPVQDTTFDPVGPSAGPSERFYDLVEGGKLMERGYTFVMVDLRGFGGSSGCLDWSGPGEQADVKAAVEWAASQPWSTGRVGMYGKSYDGVTGLVGVVSKPKGLEAVVAQEPVYDMYRYLYSNGVRYQNSLATPALYNAIAVTPGPLLDSPMYNISGATDPACLATNYAAQQDSDHESPYWKVRDLIAPAKGATVPLFLTQGFLENNTKPDGAFDFFNALAGPKRAWFGMWDHVRGNDMEGERLKMGRPGWFDETMRFFDHYVRGLPLADAPTDKDPTVVVQTSDGSWRGEKAWPPADAINDAVKLKPGSYTDDGLNNGSNSAGTGSPAGQKTGDGVWTISPELPYDVHLAGTPKVEIDLSVTAPNTNVAVDVYDIDADRKTLLLSRATSLVSSSGKVSLDMLGNDWIIPAGHRIGILVTGSNAEWWAHVPTNTTVTVNGGIMQLPFLKYLRPEHIAGEPSLRLEEWTSEAPFTLAADVLAAAVDSAFSLPARMTAAPVPQATKPITPRTTGKRLRVRIARKGRRVTVYGDAPTGARLTVKLLRGKRAVATKRVRSRVNAFRVTFKVRRGGRYTASVTGKAGTTRLRARSKPLRVR